MKDKHDTVHRVKECRDDLIQKELGYRERIE
jgi:hypothetical protein